ncbi:MAG: tryptophan--tRNA ligase [Patescibacteria group bacterium]
MRIFSGIRPSGKLHIGNYLGAIKQWIKLQEKNEAIFAVVDYHAITTPFAKKELKNDTLNAILDYLAAGVNPEKSALILQSQIPEHLELAWIFASTTPLSWFERVPTYKEKTESNPEYISLGLLSYPALMAADILLYGTTHVPIGEDQLPHIELTNNISRRFNNTFGDTFQKIKPILAQGARIKSLQNPLKKMSKTGDAGIALSDEPDTIRDKIKKAVTDSGAEIKYTDDKPAISNLLTLYSEFSEKKITEIEKEYTGKGYAEFKKDLAEIIVDALKDFREKRKEFANNKDYILQILKSGKEKAQEQARKTLKKVKEAIGITI